MNIEELREYCLTVKGAEECFPFDDTTLVFKIMGKMFAYIGLKPRDGRFLVNLKCDADRAVLLREQYTGIQRGAHTASLMWNAVALEEDVPDELLRELIDHSVEEVVKALPKKRREEYLSLE